MLTINDISQTYAPLLLTDIVEGERTSAGIDGSFKGTLQQVAEVVAPVVNDAWTYDKYSALVPELTARFTTGASNVTGDGTAYLIKCNSVSSNNLGGYSTATGIYTVPSTGSYEISFYVTIMDIGAAHTSGFGLIQIDGVTSAINICNPALTRTGANELTIAVCDKFNLTAGNQVTCLVQVFNSTLTVDVGAYTFGTSVNIKRVR